MCTTREREGEANGDVTVEWGGGWEEGNDNQENNWDGQTEKEEEDEGKQREGKAKIWGAES